MYDLAALEEALRGSIYEGKLHYAAATGSTNTDAMEAARTGSPHGSVFFADEQLAGRGRADHKWHSAAGEGLYASVLLRPAIAADQLALLPLIAGLAAATAIGEVAGLKVDLRWPNDLLIGERKTGGILVESRIDRDRVDFAVVGIGINVHQLGFDPDLATPATSLDLEAKSRVSRQHLLVCLLKSLQREAESLGDSRAVVAILQRIEESSTWLRGRRVEVHGPQACVGQTEGLDERGFLRMRTVDGLATIQTGGIRAIT